MEAKLICLMLLYFWFLPIDVVKQRRSTDAIDQFYYLER
jgi:hypothetical protein